MRYENLTTPLPEEVVENIYGFAPHVFEGLMVAGFVQGNMKSGASPSTTSFATKLLDLETFTPDYKTAPRVSPTAETHSVDNMYSAWRTKGYHQIAAANAVSAPENWTDRREALISPLTISEQEVLAGMVRSFVSRSVYMERIMNALRTPSEHTVQNIEARMLGILFDSVALPRVMAGIDFGRDRSSAIEHIKRRYHMLPNGIVGDPHNLQHPTALLLMRQIPWKLPCLDTMPERDRKQAPTVLRQATAFLIAMATTDPERLRKPLLLFDSQEFRSPFRANPPMAISDLIKSGGMDKDAIAQMCEGVPLEVPRRYEERASRKPKAPVETIPPGIAVNEDLQKRHAEIMDQIRTKPLGRQLTHLVTSGKGRIVLPGSSAEDAAEANEQNALTIHGRLINIARIFFEAMNQGGILPPSITFDGFPPATLDSVILRFDKVQAMHLAVGSIPPNPEDISSGLLSAKKLSVAVIVEGENKRMQLSFQGLYFDILVTPQMHNGAHLVKVWEPKLKPTRKIIHDLLFMKISPDGSEG